MEEEETVTQIAEVLQSSLAVNGQLAFPFYKLFWSNLNESPENAACYLAVLLGKLVGITTGEDKHTPLPDLVQKIITDKYDILASEVQKLIPDQDPSINALKQSIMLTLYFMGIHVKFAVVHPIMNQCFAKWIEFHAIQRWVHTKTPFVDEVIAILTSSIDNEQSLSHIIDAVSSIDVPMDLTQDLSDARHLSRALLSSWLIRGSSFSLSKLIDSVLNVLKAPNLAESRVLVVFHMLKRLIIHAPYIPPDTVRNALSLLKEYYLWPRPYGDYAREVMEILSSEANNPGHFLRSIVLNEFPSVLKENIKVRSQLQAKGRAAHVLVDTQYSDGSIMYDLIKLAPTEDPAPLQLTIDLLGNILYRVLGIEGDVLGVEHCPPDLISELLSEAIHVMDTAATLPAKDARAYRHTHISAIREKVINNFEFESSGSPPRHPVPPPFQMSIIQLKCSNTRPRRSDELTDTQFRFPNRRHCVQALSQILSSHQRQPSQNSSPSSSPNLNGTASPMSNRQTQKHPNPPNFSVPINTSSNPSRKSMNRKSGNAQQSTTPPSVPSVPSVPSAPPPPPPAPRPVRIMVIGSDAALHNVVTAYVTLRREQPSLFSGLDVRFYIIPVAPAPPLTITASLPSPLITSPATNNFTSFLAKNDPWYYRHIWVGTYALTSIIPSGATSLSISQLQDLSAKSVPYNSPSSPSPGTMSFRQRSKSRATLSVLEVDRLSMSGSLVESIKAVQKQKLAQNAFLSPKSTELVNTSGSEDEEEIDKREAQNSDKTTPNEKIVDAKVQGTNINTTNSVSTTSTINPTTNNATTKTTTTTSTTNINTPSTNISSSSTTTITSTSETLIISESTEVLAIRRPKNQENNTSTEAISRSNDANANGTDSKNRIGDAEGRKGSVGSTSSNSPRSRSNSNEASNSASTTNLSSSNGVVVGQRVKSVAPNALPKSVSSNAFENTNKTDISDPKANGVSPASSPVTSPSISSPSNTPSPSSIPPHAKAIFRRSNSMSNNMTANTTTPISYEEPAKSPPRSTKSSLLHHSHSVASFNVHDIPNKATHPASLGTQKEVATSPVSSASSFSSPSPARMLRQEIDTFIRDASQRLNVVVFQAECWTISGDETLYFTVPFVIRAELGIAAYTRAFTENNDLPLSLSPQDIASHKLFKYAPPTLNMKCTAVNLMGVARTTQTMDPKPYVSIALSNLGPLDKAQPNNANPTRPWLELYTVEADPKKRKKEESHTYYVSSVDMETEGKKLVDILFDGEYYGGVYRVRISTCTAPALNPQSRAPIVSQPATLSGSLSSPNLNSPSLTASLSTISSNDDEQIVFPVMTYLPLNLP